MARLSQLAEQNLSTVFNERNRRKRRAALKDLWTFDGVLGSAEGTYVGYRAIEQAIDDLLRRCPEFDFTAIGEVDEIPDAARMRWAFGAVGIAPAITGMDIINESNGRIVAMFRFLDGAGL